MLGGPQRLGLSLSPRSWRRKAQGLAGEGLARGAPLPVCWDFRGDNHKQGATPDGKAWGPGDTDRGSAGKARAKDKGRTKVGSPHDLGQRSEGHMRRPSRLATRRRACRPRCDAMGKNQHISPEGHTRAARRVAAHRGNFPVGPLLGMPVGADPDSRP